MLAQQRTPQDFLRSHEGMITAIALGGFFILLGSVFVFNDGLWQRITAFFENFTTRTFPFGGPDSVIALPAPANPAAHATLYNAVLQFDIGMGFLQIIILALRLMYKSRIGRIAETVGNAVFWFGAAPLVAVFLLPGTLGGWFQYWAALIVIIGISVVVRAIVHVVKR